MTKREINALFGLFALNWPQSSFAKTDPKEKMTIINLWEKCTNDIDGWTGEQAAYRLCKECKFAPNIAEFRQKAVEVEHDLCLEANNALNTLRLYRRRKGQLDDYIGKLPPNSPVKRAYMELGDGNLCNFNAAYIRTVKHSPPGAEPKAIGAKPNEQV